MRWHRPRGPAPEPVPVDYAASEKFCFVRAVNWQGKGFSTHKGEWIPNGAGAWLPKPYAETLIEHGVAKIAEVDG